MPRFTLRLAAAKEVPADEAASSFYWLTDQRSSFTPGVGPSLGTLGAVPDINIDVVRIALAAFAADRSVLREGRGSNWNQRQLDLEIPVSDAARWHTVADELADVLGFLSGDRWTLTFTEEQSRGLSHRRLVLTLAARLRRAPRPAVAVQQHHACPDPTPHRDRA